MSKMFSSKYLDKIARLKRLKDETIGKKFATFANAYMIKYFIPDLQLNYLSGQYLKKQSGKLFKSLKPNVLYTQGREVKAGVKSTEPYFYFLNDPHPIQSKNKLMPYVFEEDVMGSTGFKQSDWRNIANDPELTWIPFDQYGSTLKNWLLIADYEPGYDDMYYGDTVMMFTSVLYGKAQDYKFKGFLDKAQNKHRDKLQVFIRSSIIRSMNRAIKGK
jgi:hypothetical protein